MKNFRYCAFFTLAICLLLAVQSNAQQRLVTTPVLTQGQTLVFGTVAGVASDSLQVSDSIAYIMPITHTNVVDPYYTWVWNKIGSGTATITLAFLQNNDGGSTWFPVNKGVAQSAYTKSYTLSATTTSQVDFRADSAVFNGRYLKIYFITSATASVKGKLYNQLHAVIK